MVPQQSWCFGVPVIGGAQSFLTPDEDSGATAFHTVGLC